MSHPEPVGEGYRTAYLPRVPRQKADLVDRADEQRCRGNSAVKAGKGGTQGHEAIDKLWVGGNEPIGVPEMAEVPQILDARSLPQRGYAYRPH